VCGEILEFKVDADGGQVGLLKGIICEPAEEGGLADRAVTDKHDLVLVVLGHLLLIRSKITTFIPSLSHPTLPTPHNYYVLHQRRITGSGW
jgi:hypothetical protein